MVHAGARIPAFCPPTGQGGGAPLFGSVGSRISGPAEALLLAAICSGKGPGIYNYAPSGHFENLYVSRLPVHHGVKSPAGGIHQTPSAPSSER